jgi:tyrosyl-tRNA synthetase
VVLPGCLVKTQRKITKLVAGKGFRCIFVQNRLIMNLIEELKWRGMVQDIMPGTEEILLKEPITGYIGFDPTAGSVHIGSLVPILLLVHLQRAGHKPIALAGGATGMVGDPSGKSEERNLLDEETLQRNLEGISRQLGKYLDFNPDKPNAAEMVNNYDWFKGYSFLNFIRDVGKHITVNYMMSKDSVKKRLEGANGMSFTEFSYQLVQGYDFYYLYTHKNCRLQMGGSDQWGNIVTGAELIRRKSGGEALAFTCPLITKADGGKFGKTEKGNIWLDSEKTNPYQFYQFWLNASDADAGKWIRIFTFLKQEEIMQLELEHQQNPAARILQKKMAEEITRFVHGDESLAEALETTAKFFGKQETDITQLSAEDLEQMQGVERFPFPADKIIAGTDIISFLTDSGIFPSRGEARKMIQNGGLSLNREKVAAIELTINNSHLLHGRYILVQKGKKNHYLVTIS